MTRCLGRRADQILIGFTLAQSQRREVDLETFWNFEKPEGPASHDSVTKLLSGKDNSSKSNAFACILRYLIRKYRREDTCAIFDDVIIENPYDV